MSLLEASALSVVIAANNFAVAIVLGAFGMARRRARIAGAFGVVSFVVVLAGLALGRGLSEELATVGEWIGVGVLAALGATSIRQAHHRDAVQDARLAARATSWSGLVLLSLGISGDNLAVGFAFGLRDASVLVLSTLIAVAAWAVTLVGLGFGEEAGRHWARRAQVAAGVALLAVAVGLGVTSA